MVGLIYIADIYHWYISDIYPIFSFENITVFFLDIFHIFDICDFYGVFKFFMWHFDVRCHSCLYICVFIFTHSVLAMYLVCVDLVRCVQKFYEAVSVHLFYTVSSLLLCTVQFQFVCGLLKLLLQKFPQYATDFVFFTEKKVVLGHFTWQSAEQSQWQNAGTSEEEA